jgi:lysophospholipase L1-like esterase
LARIVVACLGDSITAGSPLWDPDVAVRARIGDALDERSQWEWWAALKDPRLDMRNHGVYGERTDEIAARLQAAVAGAHVLIVQGGINDIAQGLPVDQAARNIAGMLARGRELGLAVAVAGVLPWNNGDARAASEIARMNRLVHALGAPVLPFHETLADPEQPVRMRAGCTDDGDHPSVEGHRLLGEGAFRLPV